MRTRLISAAGVLAGAAMACAPFVDFDGLDDHHGETGDGALSDSGARDGDRDALAPCVGQNNGFYCGDDGLDGYAGSASDLVYCLDNAVSTITPCANGCVIAPFFYPDTCDPCSTRPSGAWCGKEMTPALRPELANVVFHCQSGKSARGPEACADAAPACVPRDGAAACGP